MYGSRVMHDRIALGSGEPACTDQTRVAMQQSGALQAPGLVFDVAAEPSAAADASEEAPAPDEELFQCVVSSDGDRWPDLERKRPGRLWWLRPAAPAGIGDHVARPERKPSSTRSS